MMSYYPIRVTDQLGRILEFKEAPKRIVSLVPSQTEYLFDLGLNDSIIGITNFCIHPGSLVTSKQKVGGTKNFRIEDIKKLSPDLIVCNKEENTQALVEELEAEFKVWITDVNTITEATDMMWSLAYITSQTQKGNVIISQVKKSFAQFSASSQTESEISVAYFIWRKPYMVAAGRTFINYMINIAGLRNVFEDINRYPEVTLEDLRDKKPDYIFLSSEPYAFTSRHFDEFKEMCPASKVLIVNGEMFSWYGSRLLKAAEYLNSVINQLRVS